MTGNTETSEVPPRDEWVGKVIGNRDKGMFLGLVTGFTTQRNLKGETRKAAVCVHAHGDTKMRPVDTLETGLKNQDDLHDPEELYDDTPEIWEEHV